MFVSLRPTDSAPRGAETAEPEEVAPQECLTALERFSRAVSAAFAAAKDNPAHSRAEHDARAALTNATPLTLVHDPEMIGYTIYAATRELPAPGPSSLQASSRSALFAAMPEPVAYKSVLFAQKSVLQPSALFGAALRLPLQPQSVIAPAAQPAPPRVAAPPIKSPLLSPKMQPETGPVGTAMAHATATSPLVPARPSAAAAIKTEAPAGSMQTPMQTPSAAARPAVTRPVAASPVAAQGGARPVSLPTATAAATPATGRSLYSDLRTPQTGAGMGTAGLGTAALGATKRPVREGGALATSDRPVAMRRLSDAPPRPVCHHAANSTAMLRVLFLLFPPAERTIRPPMHAR